MGSLTSLLEALECKEIDELLSKTPKHFSKLGEVIKDSITERSNKIVALGAELENQKQLYAAHIGDEYDNCGIKINQKLQDENERLREKCSRVGEYLNLIFIELYGFAGATMHENGLKTMKSLRAFLDDTEGLSDEYIAKELKRNGIEPEALVKRGLAMIEKAKSKSALEVDGD